MTVRSCKYRRISDDKEGDELGVTRQDVDLDAFNASRGHEVVADYMDNDVGASGARRKPRTDYQRMLDDARAGLFQVVTAYTSSRITRRPREFEDLIDLAQQYGTRFEFIRSPSFDLNTADGRMVARMLAAADAAEAERIGERVARQRLGRIERGLPPPGHAFGYTPDGRSLDVVRAVLLEAAYADVLDDVALYAIKQRWNAAGFTTMHGNAWTAKAVKDVLLNPRNAGLVSSNRVLLPGVEAQWPAIVDPDVWHGVVAILTDPARLRHNRGTKRLHLLSGVAKCGIDGTGLVTGGSTRTGKRVLICRRSAHLSRDAPPIEEFVTDTVLAFLRRRDAAPALRPPRTDLGPLRASAKALRAQRKELAERDDLDLDFAAMRDAKLRRELAAVDAQIAAMRGSVLSRFEGADADAVWEPLDVHERRAVIDELVHVRVLPVGRGSRGGATEHDVLVTPR